MVDLESLYKNRPTERPTQDQVFEKTLPTLKDQNDYERALVALLAHKGMGLNVMKRIFEHRTKDEVRRMWPK